MGLLRKADALGHGIHVSAQVRMGEGDVTKGEGGITPDLAADLDPGIGDRIARALVHQAGFAGTTVSFVNFKDELPYFIDKVLPLLREAGLRQGP